MILCVLVSSLLVLSSIAIVAAKPSLSVSFYKNNGYGMGNDVNGQWTINTEVSDNTTHVEFYLDNQLQLNDTTAPYQWEFTTETFNEGTHTLKLVAYDASGETAIFENQKNFVGFPMTFVVGIISVVVVVFVIALIISAYRIKKEAAKKRAKYGN
jgi:ABC-type transport system involved in multi-copper enzyme maturation permease subunit